MAILVEEKAKRIKRSKARKRGKHTVAPVGFETAWQDYEKRFAPPLQLIAKAEDKKQADDFMATFRAIAAKRNQDVDTLLTDLVAEIESRKQPGDSFDPMEDDPASLIEEIFMTYGDMVGQGMLDAEADKAIGAWKFFDETIGLGHREIYNRWKKVPELLIPAHALSNNSRPIVELYNEAVRTYVFGNKIASISMCRALLEHVLEKHYRISDENLAKVIAKAEGAYPKLRKLRMQNKRLLGNRVLHDYENQASLEDQSVIEFLRTIQALVSDIPQ